MRTGPFFAGAPSVIDLKTGGYTGGSPEDYILAGASTQLAHFYGVPMAMHFAGTQTVVPSGRRFNPGSDVDVRGRGVKVHDARA